MRRSWLGLAALVSSLGCGGEAPDCPGERVTTDGETFCVVPADAGAAEDAGAIEVCPGFEGINDRIETASDGERTQILAETPLGRTTWSRDGAQLVPRGGWLWWAESNDRCGMQGGRVWWGFNTFRFRGNASGAATEITQTCEPETFPLLGSNAALSSSGTLLVCGEGHHPSQFLLCGTIGEPGTFTETVFLERPRSFRLGRRAEGFALLHRHLDTGERAIDLLDVQGRPERTVAVPDAPGAFRAKWIEQVGDELWIGRVALADGEPLEVERIAADGTLRTEDELPAPVLVGGFPSSSMLAPLSNAVAGADHASFVLREDTADTTRVHLALVRADGRFATRLIGVGVRRARLAAWRSGFVVAVQHPADGDEAPRVELLRLDCAGRLLESPLELASGAGLELRAMAVLEEDQRAWVVVSTEVEPDVFDHAVIATALP